MNVNIDETLNEFRSEIHQLLYATNFASKTRGVFDLRLVCEIRMLSNANRQIAVRIATHVTLSERTLRTHLKHKIRKINILWRNSVWLYLKMFQNGLSLYRISRIWRLKYYNAYPYKNQHENVENCCQKIIDEFIIIIIIYNLTLYNKLLKITT